MKKLGKLTVTENTFNENEKIISSELLGTIGRFNINDFRTNQECEEIVNLFASSGEMLDILLELRNCNYSASIGTKNRIDIILRKIKQ